MSGPRSPGGDAGGPARAPHREARSGDALVAQCRTLLMRQLFEVWPTMMNKVDDALYDLADKAEDNRTQAIYFDAMRHVRLQRSAMETRFREALAGGMDAAMARRRAEPAAAEAGGGLTLLDPDELEESLAVATMVEKVNKTCRQSLFALERRVAALTEGRAAQTTGHPFEPQIVCEAFRSACGELQLDISLRLRVLKLFDRHVVSESMRIYDALNALLVQHGVLPEIRAQLRVNPDQGPTRAGGPSRGDGAPGTPGGTQSGVAPGRAGPAPEGTPVATVAGPGTHVGAGQGPGLAAGGARLGDGASGAAWSGAGLSIAHLPGQVLDTLHQVMTIHGANELSADAAMQGAVIANLNQLQHQVLDAGTAGGEFVNHVSTLRGSELAAQMQPVDQILIDVVAMMFDYIFGDHSMPSEMQALLGRLQIPVLKVAILDKSFFARKFHVARGLLNKLAEAGLGWNDRYGGDAAFYERIEGFVQRVIDEFEDNLEVFDEVAAELDAFIAEEDRRAEENAWWTVKVIEGQERLARARAAVRELIDEPLARPGLPRTVRDFLSGHWRELLTSRYVKEGGDSAAWQQAESTTREFVWSLFPQEDDPQWRGRLLRELHGIVNAVRESLRELPLSAAQATHFFDILSQHHVNVIRGASPEEMEALDDGPATTLEDVDDTVTADHTPVRPATPGGLPDGPEVFGLLREQVVDGVRAAVELANSEVLALAAERPECKGMGTTVVVTQFNQSWLTVGHVGDSRLYRLRDADFEQLTRDHSLREDLIAKGFYTRAEAEQKVASNYVTRAIGVDADLKVDINQQSTQAGDVLMLCSDGLTDMLADAEVERILRAHLADLHDAAQALVDAANAAGGRDNVSVALVRVLSTPAPQPEAPATAGAPHIEVAGVCDAGRRRSNNKDCVYASARSGLVIVADGMGGHNAGEVASALTVETIREAMAVVDFAAPARAGSGQEATEDQPNVAAIDVLLWQAEEAAGPPAAAGAEPATTDAVDIVLTASDGKPDTDWDAFDPEYLDQARAIKVGTWVQFTRPDGEVKRARLSSISDVTGKYLFTDRSGATVADPSLHGLAIELLHGSAAVLDDVPLFDRAMSSLTHTLRGLQGPSIELAPEPARGRG